MRESSEVTMTSRRAFLGAMTAGLGAAAFGDKSAFAADALPPEVKTSLGAPVGLQLYSLRDYAPKDLPGTLAKVRALGIVEVESAGLYDKDVATVRAALDKAGLKCSGSHIGYDRWQKDIPGAVKEAKTLGARFATIAWIKGEKAFSREDALRASAVFNEAGKACAAEGIRLCYHCHGYEFVPSPEGTLWDTIVKTTDPKLVSFEVDVYWAQAGGIDPAKLIASLPGRVPLLHVKDMAKGLSLPPGSYSSDNATNVVVGTGQIDWPAVFRAAKASGGEIYYIEDESPKVWEQLPLSLKYLSALKL
jgi:sugar phosphate isomerase/epimerase